MFARTEGGPGPAVNIDVTTLEDIPGRVPPIAIDPQSSSNLAVSWNTPGEPNGVITGYR